MPIPLENLAMVESGWPGASWNCEWSSGPRRGQAHSAHPPARLAKFHAPEIVFGPGALAEVGHCAARLGARRPFLVTDPGLIAAGWVDAAVAYLRQSGLHPAVWHDVSPNPKDHEIEAAFQRYAESGSDVIIGLGGGSCIDAAKGVAILSGNGGRILGYEGVDQVVCPIPPTVMVPSTSGTGADVSQLLLDVARGAVNGVLLPHVIRFNAEAQAEQFVPLAEAAGLSTDGVPAHEVALLLAERVRELADEVGVPSGLATLGVTEAVLPQLARTTLTDACLAANPREADARDIEALFRAAL